MTEITLKRGETELDFSAKGHCNAAENGVDLVCSAVSMLSCTLINRLEELSVFLKEKHISYEKGLVEIFVRWNKRDCALFDNSIDTLLCGYRLISNAFPENVRLSVTRNEGKDYYVKKKRY